MSPCPESTSYLTVEIKQDSGAASYDIHFTPCHRDTMANRRVDDSAFEDPEGKISHRLETSFLTHYC